MSFWRGIEHSIKHTFAPIGNPKTYDQITQPIEKLPGQIKHTFNPISNPKTWDPITQPIKSLPGEINNKILSPTERLANQTVDKLKTIAISTAGEVKATAIRDAMTAAKISGQALDGIEAGSKLAISYLEKGVEEVELYGEIVVEWLDEHACEIGISVALGTVFAAMFDAPDPETVVEDTAATAPLTAVAADFLATGEKVGLRAACDTTANAFVDIIWIAPAVRNAIGNDNKELLTLSIAGTLETTIEVSAGAYLVPVAAATLVAGIVAVAVSSLACEHTVPKGTPARAAPPKPPTVIPPKDWNPTGFESTAPKGANQVWISGQGNSEWSNSKVIAGDFQGSRKTDIAVFYDYGKAQTGLWLLSKGSNFQPTRPWVTSPGYWDCSKSVEVLAGDYSGSGKTDLAVFYDYGNSVTGLWLFKSDSHFQPIRAWISFPGKWGWIQSNKAISGNFRGTGKADIAVFYDYGNVLGQTGLWLFASDSNFQPTMVWDSGPRNWDWSQSKAISGDFKGSGKTDIAVFYNYGNSQTRLWLFASEHNFQPYLLWDSGPGNFDSSKIVKVISGDFKGTGKTDIAVFYDHGENKQGLWLFTSESNFQPTQVWETSGWAVPQGVITGDFNGSGKTDIAAFFCYGKNAYGLVVFSSNSNFQPTGVWQSGVGELDWSRVVKVITGNFTDPEKTDIALLYDYPNTETGLWILPTQKEPEHEMPRNSIPVSGRRIHATVPIRKVVRSGCLNCAPLCNLHQFVP